MRLATGARGLQLLVYVAFIEKLSVGTTLGKERGKTESTRREETSQQPTAEAARRSMLHA